MVELKAGFVYIKSTEETKVHEKLLPLLKLLSLTHCQPCSERLKNNCKTKKKKRAVLRLLTSHRCPFWVRLLPVKRSAICSWIRESMKWWGVRLHALLWSERCEFKGPASSIEAANEATDSPHHLTAWWFIHSPTPVEEVNLWLQGYCRLEPAKRDAQIK